MPISLPLSLLSLIEDLGQDGDCDDDATDADGPPDHRDPDDDDEATAGSSRPVAHERRISTNPAFPRPLSLDPWMCARLSRD